MRISLPSDADIHQWQILIDGPKGSPYEVCRLSVVPDQLPVNLRKSLLTIHRAESSTSILAFLLSTLSSLLL